MYQLKRPDGYVCRAAFNGSIQTLGFTHTYTLGRFLVPMLQILLASYLVM